MLVQNALDLNDSENMKEMIMLKNVIYIGGGEGIGQGHIEQNEDYYDELSPIQYYKYRKEVFEYINNKSG